MQDWPIQIVGRTGSLFTRVPLIFAEELGIRYELVVVDDLAATDPAAYGGHIALRIPVMRDAGSVLFGAQNICRALAERAAAPGRIVWPEDLRDVSSRNAQELVWQAMATQVQILMGTEVGGLPGDNLFFAKALAGLQATLRWLDEHVAGVLVLLPPQRRLSMFEVSLFCLVEHLRFGPTASVESHGGLLSFARDFGARPSALRTIFR